MCASARYILIPRTLPVKLSKTYYSKMNPTLPKNINITVSCGKRGPAITYNGITLTMEPTGDGDFCRGFNVGDINVCVFYWIDTYGDDPNELVGHIEVFDEENKKRIDDEYFLTLTEENTNRYWRNWEYKN